MAVPITFIVDPDVAEANLSSGTLGSGASRGLRPSYQALLRKGASAGLMKIASDPKVALATRENMLERLFFMNGDGGQKCLLQIARSSSNPSSLRERALSLLRTPFMKSELTSLRALAFDSRTPGSVRLRAALGLAECEDRSSHEKIIASVDSILRGSSAKDSCCQRTAIFTLHQLHDARALPLLTKIALRTESESRLGIQILCREQGPKALPYLKQAALAAKDERSVLALVDRIVEYGDYDFLRTLSKSASPAKRLHGASELFRKTGDDTLVPIIAKALPYAFNYRIFQCLAAHPRPSVYHLLQNVITGSQGVLSKESHWAREEAARALLGIGTASAAIHVLECLRHRNGRTAFRDIATLDRKEIKSFVHGLYVHAKRGARDEASATIAYAKALEKCAAVKMQYPFEYSPADLVRVVAARKRYPEGKGTDFKRWAKNTSVFSSTGSSYGWNTHYVDALCRELGRNPTNFHSAHDRAAATLRRHPVVVTRAEARSMNEEDLAELSKEEKKHFKPMKAGTYKEIPAESRSAEKAGWTAGRHGEVLIIVGAEKKDKTIGFADAAKRLKASLERIPNTRVRIVSTPSKGDIEGHLARMALAASRGTDIQAMVFFVGHGGASVDETGKKSWAERNNGSFWLRSKHDAGGYAGLSENQFRELSNRYLSRAYGHVTLVFDCCHSESWVE